MRVVKIFKALQRSAQKRPVFTSKEDLHGNKELDLNSHLIEDSESTFFVKVAGDSMIKAGISDGALLVVDRSLTAKHEQIIMAKLNGDFTVRRLIKTKDRIILSPENPAYQGIEITPEMDFSIWGVVTNIIHQV